MMRQCLLVASMLIATAVPFAAKAAEPQFTMKMGTATINDAQHEWLKRFAEKVGADSNGRIKVEVYPASQLGSIPRMIEQTQFGAAQGWVGPSEFLSGVDIRFEVPSAPELFDNVEQANRVIQDPDFAPKFLKIGEKKGLIGLGLFISGPATFVSPKPIRTLAEFSGLKIRVTSSPLQTEPLKAMGAAPVPMALGEVLPALQQGALNGVMGDAPVLYNLRYASVAKYQLQTDQMMYITIATTSKSFFDKLPADLQKIVLDDGTAVSRDIYDYSVKAIDDSLLAWKADGGEVYRLPPNDEKELKARLVKVGETVANKRPEEREVYEDIKKTVSKYK